MEDLKNAEVALYASGIEPDYAQNEYDELSIEYLSNLLVFLFYQVNSITLNGKVKKYSNNVFWKHSKIKM